MLGDRELTAEERRLILRFGAAIAIPLAMITASALIVGALFFQGQINGQIDQNSEAISRAETANAATKNLAKRINRERRTTDKAIAQAVFHECVENELQDNVLVAQVLRPTIQALKRAQQQNPSPQLRRYIENLSLAILAREPPGERDCQLPGGNR